MRRLIPELLTWALILLVGLTPLTPPALAASVDWREVPATDDGRQWWDAGSLHLSCGGNLSVLSRFQPAGDAGKPRSPDLYVMEVDCGQKLYRDRSVNGLPRFGAQWQAPAGDGLIESVIEASCAAGSALLQAA
jgi:hypothetical protein